MIFRDYIKATVLSGILAKSAEIKIDHSDPMGIIKEVLDENPTLLVYIGGYSASGHSLLGGYTIKIKYKNLDIPNTRIFYAKNAEDVNKILHIAMEKFMPDVAIVSNKSLDVAGIVSDFWSYYEGFYSNCMSYSSCVSSFKDNKNHQSVFNFKYRIGRVMLNMMENAVDREVERLRGILFCKGMPDIVKAYVAHNYLAATIEYWYNENATSLEASHMQSAYGGLIDHKCVCQGYAEAYKRLLDIEGIFCDVICGKIKGSLEYHAWNIVRLDGENYHVDVTWDSESLGIVDFKYFCLSDSSMKSKRYWTRRMNLVCLSDRNIAEAARADIRKNKERYISLGIDKKYLI